jgi:hypothetical protein
MNLQANATLTNAAAKLKGIVHHRKTQDHIPLEEKASICRMLTSQTITQIVPARVIDI